MSQPHKARVVYEFGSFRLDPCECRLTREGHVLPLGPKALEMLAFLVVRPGRLVEKAELLRELWPDTAVEESNLSQHVYLVRKALGDEAGDARWIQTVPKRGYRFVGAVRCVDADDTATEAVPAAVPRDAGWPPEPSTEGSVHEDVRSDGRSRAWGRAAAPGAVARLPPLPAALGVLALVALTGGVWWAVRARPSQPAAGDMAPTSGTANGPSTEQSAVPVARTVSAGSARLPAHPAAYDAYVRGLYFWSQRTSDGLREAERLFEQAIAHVPDYAPAWAALADARGLAAEMRYGSLPPEQTLLRARAAALHALQLDATLAEAHVAMALVHGQEEGGRRAAEREYKIALALDPRAATALQRYAKLLIEDGRLADATVVTERALALDPRAPALNANLCYFLYLGRDYTRAAGYCDKALELQPDLPQPLLTRALIQMQEGRLDRALASLESARRQAQGRPLLEVLEAQGYALARSGRRAHARAAFEELRRMTKEGQADRIHLLGIHAALGETESAFEVLRDCLREGDERLFAVAFDPRYDGLRRDPRYVELMSRGDSDSAGAGGSDVHETVSTLF